MAPPCGASSGRTRISFIRGFPNWDIVGPEPSPIIATIVDTPRDAIALWKGLLDRGIYVNLIVPPAAPEGKSLVRCSVSAVHTNEQMTYIGDTFAELRKSSNNFK